MSEAVSPKKKVLYISPNGYLGGAERVVLTLAEAHLSTNNFEPIILFYSNGEAVKAAKSMGIKCLVLNEPCKLSSPIKLFKALRAIRRIILSERPSLIHNTMAYSHLTSSLATLDLDIKRVWFQHGPVGKILDRLASFFPTDLLLFNSSYLRNLHHRTYPHVRIKHQEEVIRLGVASSENHRIFHKEIVTLGAAGRITPFKGFENIIKALSEIKKSGKHKPFQLLIAGTPKSGEDQKYNEALIGLVKKLDLENEIRFIGHIENMHEFYSQVDVFVHASIFPEPFGLVVAEAMSHGCLTIAQNLGGISDFLSDKKTGITYENGNLAPKLSEVLDAKFNDDDFRKYALNGREIISTKFSSTNMINQIESLYLRCLKD